VIDYFLALTFFCGLLFWQLLIFEKAAFLNPLIGYTNPEDFWLFGGIHVGPWLLFELKFVIFGGFFSLVRILIQFYKIELFDC